MGHPPISPRAVLFFVLALALAVGARAQPRPMTFNEIVDRSGFIFLGTVKAIGAATPTIARKRNTAIVTVERVIDARPPVGNPTGKDVTVLLRNPQRTRNGQRAIFFTYVQTAGATLGLVEVATQPVAQEQATEERIKQARQTLADQALARRLARAQLVVVGVFGEGQPTEGARERISEHDPLWWRAPINVESFEKGRPAAPNEPVIVHYAISDDVVWERAPKPKAGEAGIFLLQPDRERRFSVSGLFLIDPLDVQPPGEIERVRRLLKTIRP
jgi:hypothetical protein